MATYIVLEDGTSKLLLEDASGLLNESSTASFTGTATFASGTHAIAAIGTVTNPAVVTPAPSGSDPPYYKAKPWMGSLVDESVTGVGTITAGTHTVSARGRVVNPKVPDLTPQYVAKYGEHAVSQFHVEQAAAYARYASTIQPIPPPAAVRGVSTLAAGVHAIGGEGFVASKELQDRWQREDESLLFALMAAD